MKVASFQAAPLLVVGISFLLSTCHAFQHSSSSVGLPFISVRQQQREPLSFTASSSSSSSSSLNTALFQAKPKNKNSPNNTPEKEKQTGISLLFTYMTPWRNPNSIFVYMFGLLYVLGKYSESH